MYLNNGLPRKGWQYVDTVELTTPAHTCEMCGKNEIRFIHIIYHPEIQKQIEVGKVCAERLTEDYVSPKEGEKRIKKRFRWLTNGWKISAKGNIYKKFQDIVFIVYTDKKGICKWMIKKNNDTYYDNSEFEDETDAMKDIYEFSKRIS